MCAVLLAREPHPAVRASCDCEHVGDDVVQRVEGSRRLVVASLLSAGLVFADGVKALGLQLATKSAVIATKFEVAKELQQKFAQAGIVVNAKYVTADPGIDRGAITGGRPKEARRRATAGKRLQRVYRLAIISKVSRALGKKLVSTGIGPQRTHGAGVFGVAPTIVFG